MWIFHSRAMKHRINKIRKRAFRCIYPDQKHLTFKQQSEKDKNVGIHQRNFKTFGTEFSQYKTKSLLRLFF